MTPVKEMSLIDKSEVAIEKAPAGEWTSMFERLATNPAVDVSKLSALMDLRDRVLTQEAAQAFTREFAIMQGALPIIAEKATTNTGKYAPLEDIVEVVRPILKAHGFSLSHRTEWLSDGKMVKVVGILAHRDGHERTSEFVSAADTSGSKNAVQALGSAMSYGRRYTTNDLLGIVTRKEDDDAARSQARSDVEAPKGFEDWWLDMDSVADSGLKALEAAWKQSLPQYRRHVTQTNERGWAALKARAGAVREGV